VITEAHTEDRPRYEVLLERLESQVSAIAEGQTANTQGIQETKTLLEVLHGQVRVIAEGQAANTQRIEAIAEGQAANTQGIRETRALFEKLQDHVRVIAEAHGANTDSIRITRVELERQIKQVDDRVIALDVRVNQKIDALDAKLSGELARITKHLGLDEASHPERPPLRTAAKQRKAR